MSKTNQILSSYKKNLRRLSGECSLRGVDHFHGMLCDSSQEVESEGHDEDLSLGKSEASLPADVDDTHDSADPLKKPVENISHADDAESKSLDVRKDSLSPKDVELQESKVTGPQMQDKIVVKACRENVRDGTYSSEQTQSKDIVSTNDVKAKSSCAEVAGADTQMKDRPTNGGPDNRLSFKEETEKMDVQSGQSGEDIKLKASSSITPQRRPRSISPGVELEAGNKRPAMLCEFYARGWCIKGSACKFLHQKDGVSSSSKSKQDAANESSKDIIKDEEDPRVENGTEPLASTDIKKPSLSESNKVGEFGESENAYRFLDKHRENHLADHIRYTTSGSEEIVRGYSSSMAEHRLQSSGSAPLTSLYGNGVDSFGYEKRIVEPPIMYGSHSSPGYFRSSLHPTFPWSGTAPQRSSLDGSDQGYYSSRSSLLSRHSSSPFYPRSDPDSSFRGGPGDQLSSTNLYNWEPSVPFRPSFDFSSFIFSSPGSQYDPLLDSIDPPNGKYTSFHDHSLNISSQRSNTDYLPSHQQSQHGKLDQTISTHGLRAATAPSKETGEQNTNNSLLMEEKHSKPSHRAKNSNAMEVDHDPSLYNQADGSKLNKESKTLKYFRASLVEFVKELVKPHWREGHLSKDAHNSVVKRAVEKVMGSLQPHQVPNSAELTETYLSSSRTKITKLVEGYVSRITKS
ncbi:hsp70 nucleotide exchange factor fes1 [Ranunculus cassubicifolius]